MEEVGESEKRESRAKPRHWFSFGHRSCSSSAQEHRQLCQTTLALLRLLKSIKNISPLCSEHSVEVSFQRGKIMACFLFHSELISACLVILNHAGFPATNILYLAMLRVVSQAASIS